MTQLIPYLTFDGNCREAMQFYERVLGGKLLVVMTNGESPVAAEVPAGNADRVMHAAVQCDGFSIYGGDALVNAGMPFGGMKGFNLTLSYDKVADAQRVFGDLAEGGKVTMPLGETFWAEQFGMLVDRYGTPWIINGGPKQFN